MKLDHKPRQQRDLNNFKEKNVIHSIMLCVQSDTKLKINNEKLLK